MATATTLQVSFSGPSLETIAREAKDWADDLLGIGSQPKLLRSKAERLVFGISERSRRVLGTMVDITLSGKLPTPPLVMAQLGTKTGSEQGIRAIIGKVRTKIDALDADMGGPAILERAPFVDGHTQYHLNPKAAVEIRAALDRLEKLMRDARPIA